MLSRGKIKYRDGYKYQLAEDWWCVTPLAGQACCIEDPDDSERPWIRLAQDGTLSIKEGYAWDGPVADKLLQDICKDDGMSAFRAWYVYKAVRWFAESCAEPTSDEPHEAP